MYFYFKHARLLTVLSAFSISLFPLNYFFQFLFYTDSGSTLFVLASYYLMLKKYYQSSAYVAGVAVLYRQTNIVWVLFGIALVLIGNVEQLFSKANNNSNNNASQTNSQTSKNKNAGISIYI